jgi:hypothetical protein
MLSHGSRQPRSWPIFDVRKKFRMRPLYSSIGLILGFIAICVAAIDSHAARTEPPKEEKRGGVLEIGTAKHTLTLKLRRDEQSPPPPRQIQPLRITYTALGLAAIGLGTLSWIRKEHIRMSGGAAALGLLAVAWQWVLIGVCIAIVIFVLAHLSA